MTTPSDPQRTGLVDEAGFSQSLVDPDDSGAAPTPDVRPPTEGEAAEQPDWVGKKLGHFKLLGQIGSGAMGKVIRAEDINLGRIVALKVLRKRVGAGNEDKRVAQFLREARAAARIEHPSVAQIYEISQHKGWWFIAIELIEGGSLQQVVEAAGPLSPAHACPLIADAASALAVAHKLGIIHRDIKPHNLMLTRSGRCKVVDFGLVRIEDPSNPFEFTDQGVGTPMYAAPEAARKQAPTSATDIYGLGATLYFALTATPPFDGTDVRELLRQHAGAPRPDVREHNAECSESLATLVMRAMAVDPLERPTAVEFASILRVESIGQPLDASALVLDPTGSMAGDISGMSEIGLTSASRGLAATDRRRASGLAAPGRMWITRIGAALLVLGLVFGMTLLVWTLYKARGPGDVSGRAAFQERFPAAPADYGVSEAGARPATGRAETPAFSWRGRVDPQGNRFVANRAGQKAFPVDDPDAGLIPADDAVFYVTAQAAAADGKTPVR